MSLLSFFHLGMNYLEKYVLGSLWNNDGPAELGTMKCEAERIFRHSVDTNVMKAYDADRDFALSFFGAYVVEAALSYFGMETRNDAPSKHVPPDMATDLEKTQWVMETIGKFVDEMVFPCWTGNDKEDYVVQGMSRTTV